MLSLGSSFQGSYTRGGIGFPILIYHLVFCFLLSSKGIAQNHLKSENKPLLALHLSYIGNMGVLLSSGGDAVLIDGLHQAYKPAYVFPPDSTTTQIILGDYLDYGSINMALITHHHQDHFDAELSSAFLTANSGSYVLGASQVIEKIRAKPVADQRQLKLIPYDNAIHSIKQDNLEVKAFRCPHVNKARHASVQNLAYLIHLQGYSILHLGDSNWDVATDALQSAKLPDQEIDIAILPYWMLLDRASKEKVGQLIRPKKLIATHVPPDLGQRERTLLLQHHANLIIFEKLHQQLIYP